MQFEKQQEAEFQQRMNEIEDEYKAEAKRIDEKYKGTYSETPEDLDTTSSTSDIDIDSTDSDSGMNMKKYMKKRRAEIESADIKRTLIDLPYEMAGSDVGFYEENTYNAVLDLAMELPKETREEIQMVKSIVETESKPSNLEIKTLINNLNILERISNKIDKTSYNLDVPEGFRNIL